MGAPKVTADALCRSHAAKTNFKEIKKQSHAMKRIKIWNEEVSSRQLDDICASLEAGETMVMPTDTLYAIACDALLPESN